jgi:hypothetical protein
MKRCARCDQEKSLPEFYGKTGGYLSSYCKPCHKEGARRTRLPRRYGITTDQYDAMLKQRRLAYPKRVSDIYPFLVISFRHP